VIRDTTQWTDARPISHCCFYRISRWSILDLRLAGLPYKREPFQKPRNHIDSIDSIRASNQRLEKMSDSIARHLPKIDPIHADGGPNAGTPEKQKAMTDILVAALVNGLTNVVTYTIDELPPPSKDSTGMKAIIFPFSNSATMAATAEFPPGKSGRKSESDIWSKSP
jgi:hypothetical protein